MKSDVYISSRNGFSAVFDYQIAAVKKDVSYTFFPKNVYQVDTYYLLPENLLNKGSFDVEHFVEKHKHEIRLKDPYYSYKKQVGLRVTGFDFSPLERLKRLLETPITDVSEEWPLLAERNAKLFACSFKLYLERQFDRLVAEDDLSTLLPQEVGRTWNMLKLWRTTLFDLQSHPKMQEKSWKELLAADEYCSAQLRYSLAQTLQLGESSVESSGESSGESSEGSQDPTKPVGSRKINALLRLETIYCSRLGYEFICNQSTEERKEAFAIRQNLLKDKVWDVLNLQVYPRKMSFLRRHSGAMIAAAMAAFWAILSNVFIWQFLKFRGFSAVNVYDFLQANTLNLAGVVVVAYVLKDRIKDILKEYFSAKKSKGYFEAKEDICIRDLNDTPNRIGMIEERVKTIRSSDDLPEAMKKALSGDGDLPFVAARIICHSKRIKLDGKRIGALSHPLRAIRDVFELDMSFVTKQLHSSSKELLSFDPSGDLASVEVQKRYFLDIGLRYSWYDAQNETQRSQTSLKRLVLYRDGIAAIRPLDTFS